MSEFGGLWKYENNQHALVPLKMESNVAAQNGGVIKNGHMEERRKKEIALLFTFTVQKYIYPSVILCMGI